MNIAFMTSSACLLAISLALRVSAAEILSLGPPRPPENLGFRLPLAVTTIQRQEVASGGIKNFATVDVLDIRELAYLVQLSIGGQNFMVTLDTASSDLWVASSDCAEPDCQAVVTYQKTSTLALTQTPFNLKYVQGNVSGSIGYETVTFGQVEVYQQVFGAFALHETLQISQPLDGSVEGMVTSVSAIGMSGMGNSGILGLAFPKSSSIRRSLGKTLLENLYDSLDEDERFFAFNLGRGGASSSFTIGQVDPSLISNTRLSYFPVYPVDIYDDTYDYWKLPLSRINVNGTTLPFSLSKSRVKGSISPIATLDTGTSLVLGPILDVMNFWNTVGGARQDSDSGFWMVRCDRAIIVSLVFGGTDGIDAREYFLDPRDISWNGMRSGNWCLGGIQGNNKVMASDWLLGDVFLKNVYATHHAATSSTPPLIGLANLTDPVPALVAFKTERGSDPTGPMNLHFKTTSSSPTFVLLVSAAAAAGWAFGLLAILALKLGFCRRVGRKLFFH